MMKSDTSWHFQTCGKQGNPPLIFLHGFMGSGSDWREIAGGFKEHYYCVLPDIPGHGATAFDKESSIATVADGVVKLMDSLALSSTSLVGYSMGGRIALYAALKYQDRFDSLVLESANPGLEQLAEREKRVALDNERAQLLEEVGLEKFMELWYQNPLFASLQDHPDKLVKLKKSRLKGSAKHLADALRALSIGRQPSLWKQLDEIRIPVLLIAGKLDEKFSVINHRVEMLIRNSTLSLVEHAGHNVHLEKPRVYLERLKLFFNIVYSATQINPETRRD